MGGGARGDREQRDLGRGVETEAEEKTDRVHLPAMVDHPKDAAEDARHQSARHQLVLEAVAVVFAASHLPVDADDVEQHDQVHDSDQDEECARHERADRTSDVPQLAVVGDDTLHDPPHGQTERHRDQEHDGGVAEGEEESDACRSAP